MSKAAMKSAILFCVILIEQLYVTESATNANDWGYSGDIAPQYWKKKYTYCGATHQSPVDIKTSEVKFDKYLKPFHFFNTNKTDYNLENQGMNIVLNFGETIWKGDIVGYKGYCYQILQMHFHWGDDNSKGSEHTFNGKMYPLEAHFVMWNCREFKKAESAVNGVNGLAVVGVLFEVDDSGKPNPVLEELTKAIKDNPGMIVCPCTKPDDYSKVKIPYFDINQLLPEDRSQFYRYKGSLTTPPCTENVLWSVYAKTMKVTNNQLKIFRTLKFSKDSKGKTLPMVNNYRPVMPMNPEDPANALRFISASAMVLSGQGGLAPTSWVLCVLSLGAITSMIQTSLY